MTPEERQVRLKKADSIRRMLAESAAPPIAGKKRRNLACFVHFLPNRTISSNVFLHFAIFYRTILYMGTDSICRIARPLCLYLRITCDHGSAVACQIVLSVPGDSSGVAREALSQEKQQREHLLALGQVLARQVMEKSRIVAGQ
jgi:hypothetical protein